MFDVAGEKFTVVKSILNGYNSNRVIEEVYPFWVSKGVDKRAYIGGLIAEYEKSQPVRKIRASRRSVTGWINGSTHHEAVAFESTIERDCVQQLLFDQRVKHIQSQPLTIAFPKHDKENLSYTPDYLVTYQRKNAVEKILVECKPHEEWQKNQQRLSDRYKYVSEWGRKRGLNFVLLTERHIRGHSLENIKQLVPYLYIDLSDRPGFPQYRSKILSLLPASNIEVLDAVESVFPTRKDAQAEILMMLAGQRIYCDLDSPLEMTTKLWTPVTGQEPEFLFDKGIYFRD